MNVLLRNKMMFNQPIRAVVRGLDFLRGYTVYGVLRPRFQMDTDRHK